MIIRRLANGNDEAAAHCELSALRQNQHFLNNLTHNADVYDAYITTGVKPLIAAIAPLHALLDENLRISHADISTE